LEESPIQVEPKAVETPEEIAEPNVPELAPEPNDLAEAALEMPAAVELLVAEEAALALVTESQQPSQEPIEEVAQQVFEAQSMTDADEPSAEAATEHAEVPAITEPNEPADAEAQAEVEEDFLSEGLLQELADAQQEAKATQTPAETAVAEASEEAKPEQTDDALKTPAAEATVLEVPEEQDDPMKAMQALLAQARAQEEQVLVAEKQAEVTKELETIHTAEPVEEATTLQAELALLRQRLTELEDKAVEEQEPAPEMIAEETKRVPTDAAQSKIQTAQTVQTEPQFDPLFSEKELDTVIDLPQEVELEALVDLVGKQLGLNYYYDPAILKGQKVKLKIHGGKIKVRETYTLLESVLRQKGFVMTRRGALVTIIKTADAKQAAKLGDIVIREPDDPIPPGTLIVKTKFTLKNISTATAKNMLTQLQLGLVNGFNEIPETSTLIVTDYSYRMDQIQKVLDMIDVAGEKKEYEFRTLKYMKPSEVIPKLQELAKQLVGVSLQISTPATTAPKTRSVTTRDPKTGRTTAKQVPITTTKPAAAQKPQADAIFIDTDDRTNRILMAGKADQIVLVNELIDALDVPRYDLKIVREYIVENIEAAEVVDVLNELDLASVSVAAPSSRTTPTRPTSSRTPAPPSRTATPASKSAAATGGDQPSISVRPAANSLLVNATAEQHEAIELVIAHIDIVQKDQRTIRQYEIQYVDTQEIMDTLTDLEIIAPQTDSRGSSSRSSSSRSSRQTTGRTTQPPAQAGAAPIAPVSLPTAAGGSEKEITAEHPQISVLETTNSLLVYATPRQHDAIALVIAHADRTPETTSTPYVVYALENQDPLLLAEVLTRLIQETVEEVQKTSTPTSKIQTGGGTTAAANLPTLEEQNIRVIPDEMSYSLIVYANKRNQQWISELIRELDEYRPQVLLDCTLVEISRDDAFQYSIDLVAKTYGGTDLQSGTPVDPISSNIAAPFSTSSLADASSISGTFTGFFNSEMIQGLLTAMQTDGYGRVMSQPKVLVNDNQEGEIKTENVTSVAQQKSIVQPSSDQGQTITTTDVSFVEYTSGVTLKIKPHISKGDMLRLEIALNRTDFDDSVKNVLVAGNLYPQPPDLISADVTTIATVPDGTTIILGGLESVNQSKTHDKVPLLGDLPLIGTLFRSVNNNDELKKLYVFVKANIIRPGDQVEGLEDIRRVSKKYREEFEDMEDRFQNLQDFPGIKPPPMDPVRVLEDDDFQIEDRLEGDFVVQDHWPTG
jgi:type II secretory pathway component GspD/PulD (secretin)/regulator of replication initiation timing